MKCYTKISSFEPWWKIWHVAASGMPIREGSLPNIGVTTFGDDVLTEEKVKNKNNKQDVKAAHQGEDLPEWSASTAPLPQSILTKPHQEEVSSCTGTAWRACTQWCLQVHLQNYFCPLDLFTTFLSDHTYTMKSCEVRLTARGWWEKRTTAFTNCNIILYAPVVHHCPLFKTEGKVGQLH